MGDQIEFPKNYAIYTSKALEYLQINEFSKAITLLKKAYALKDEENINVLLVSALFQNGEINEALEIANEKEEFYKSNERRLLVYVEILLANQHFLHVRKHIDTFISLSHSPYHEAWVKLENELELKIEEADRKQRNKEENLVKQLFSLASVSQEEQFNYINQAEALSTDKLQKVAPSIFNNPYIHPLARTSMLSLLIERKDRTHYTYTWFDKTKMIVPSKLQMFEEHERVRSILKKAQRFFEQNPTLSELLLNELKFVLLSLYPFIDDVIAREKEEEWILELAEGINGPLESDYNVSKADKDYICSWISQIHQKM